MESFAEEVDIHEAESLFEKGLNFCAATPLLDSGGDVIDGLILGSDDGDPDNLVIQWMDQLLRFHGLKRNGTSPTHIGR